jgi:hypothetical protein
LFSDSRSIGMEIALIAGNAISIAHSDKSRMYCVGHSLGTNVCGHAGMKLKFGRITGLWLTSHTHTDLSHTYNISVNTDVSNARDFLYIVKHLSPQNIRLTSIFNFIFQIFRPIKKLTAVGS